MVTRVKIYVPIVNTKNMPGLNTWKFGNFNPSQSH